jgi:hypothetical protein
VTDGPRKTELQGWQCCDIVRITRHTMFSSVFLKIGNTVHRPIVLRLLLQVFKHLLSVSLWAFWDIASCSLLEVDRRFGGAYCLHHHIRRRENLKYHTLSTLFLCAKPNLVFHSKKNSVKRSRPNDMNNFLLKKY